ncbi:hypothetical protein [Aquirufa aurantiipilula]|uniref:Tetratricopeptide repeat protein n=1 Tax=Aquirufa aurantiipilula TaxID=2696561 RepID=A0ABT6BH31_9BACT|nr:hypothetical protein [Aquirufa aurantiipilula]MBZ1325445.1 hypothetical protein [Aquirufa aurantiipilula]MDF5689765.1 hypothetical protein [Aquirufa aurantiipilula]
MFTSYLYIFLLIYQGLFSNRASVYNKDIQQVNYLIKQKRNAEALYWIKKAKGKDIFINKELEKTQALLSIRLNQMVENSSHFSSSDSNELLIQAAILEKQGNIDQAISLIEKGIKDNPVSDTLIKQYEIYAYKWRKLLPILKSNRQNQLLQEQQNMNRINTKEALGLLDLMKKKERILIY